MKLTKVEIRRLQLPLIRNFTTGFGTIHAKETIVVKLYTADGLVGYGESSTLSVPTYNAETTDSSMYILCQFLAPAILGKRLTTIEDFLAAMPSMQGVYTAKTGIECAFWHLLAQRDNKSLKALFGGSKHEIAVGESIGMGQSLEETLQEVATRIKEGYRGIKLKIAPGWDFEVLAAIRERWPAIQLSADANASYTLERHESTLRSLDQFGLLMLEQPLASRNVVDHAQLQSLIKTPICLDESVSELEDVRTAQALGACRLINLKPMRVGGIRECLRMYDFAVSHNLGVWCGGTLETGLGRAFNIALASKKQFVYPVDMSPYELFFSEDIMESSFVVKENGYITVPDEPGLGYRVSDAQIDACTVEKVVSTA